jgi:hypothetical protein
VTDALAEYQKLKTIHESAVLLKEGGNPVVLLPDFSFRTAGIDVKMSLLLHPSAHSGYVTRLFFERPMDGRGQNWTQHRVIDRQWWAPSWQNVTPSQPWPAMLCAHLRVRLRMIVSGRLA